MATAEASQRRVIGSFVAVALIAPALITALATGIMLSWRDQLPDPVATHWGVGGEANGWSSITSVVLLTPLVSLGLPALLACMALPALRRGNRGPHLRMLGAAALGLSVLMSTLMVGSLAIQRGLEDSALAPSIGPVLWWSLGLAAVAGLAGWFIQPKQATVRDPLTPGADVKVQAGETVVWIRNERMKTWFVVLMVVLAVAIAGFGWWIVQESAWVGWLVFVLGVAIGVMAATMTEVSVSVSPEGLAVRGLLGWPHTRVAIDDVVSAEVAHVNGISDFGGWGWRYRPGASGVILRDGEAVWVKRHSGKDFAVTVDDAATAAGLLEALARREGSAR